MTSAELYLQTRRSFLILASILLILGMMPPQLGWAENQTAKTSNDWLYTLRPGESFKAVAVHLLSRSHDWTDVVRYNHIGDLSSLQAGSIIRIPMDWLKQQPQPASTLSVNGRALIKRAGTSQSSLLKAEMPIRVGDEITTRDGSVMIKFADGTLLRLEKNSTLLFNKLSQFGQTGMVDTRMRLKKGAFSTKVKPLKKGSRYEISTPSAVAAVRGTEFRLSADRNETRLEVIEGEVEFSHEHGSAIVSAGEGARIQDNAARIERKPLNAPPKPAFPEKEISDLPAKLAWEKQRGAQGYRFELSPKGSETKRLQDAELDTPEVELDNVRNGQYVASMRSVDEQGFEGMPSRSELSVQVSTEVAQLLEPRNELVLDNPSPSFSWQFDDDNVQSKLELSQDESFSEPLTRFDFRASNKRSLSSELPPGDYYWRVVSTGDDNRENVSEIRRFTVRGQIDPVKIVSVNYVGNQVGLFWKKPDLASGFLLEVSDNRSFDRILKTETLNRASAHLKLKPGKRYYARIKALTNEDYRSEFGPAKELYIQAE